VSGKSRLRGSPPEPTLVAPTLIAVRLERTRDVLRELMRSVRQAVPIMIGVAGPIFIASLALLAWAGVPPMKAVTLPWPQGAALWCVQSLVAAWPLWALRRRLLPGDWCVQLRCLPLPARALWRADFAVSATVLAPLAALYALSVLVFAVQRPRWWLAVWPASLASLAACWLVSCALGASALAWQRRAPPRRVHAPAQVPTVERSLARRPHPVAAVLWWPWWRGALTPGGSAIAVGLSAALALAGVWIAPLGAGLPGAGWALIVVALLVAVTERMQRAMEAHLERLAPWLAALPTARRWQAIGRLLVCLPMMAAGAVIVAAVLVARPWRTLPLAAFAIGMVATPLALTAVPAREREAHVGLWAVSVGVLTALGSELWN